MGHPGTTCAFMKLRPQGIDILGMFMNNNEGAQGARFTPWANGPAELIFYVATAHSSVPRPLFQERTAMSVTGFGG